MASLRKINTRLGSVRTTKKVTRAMELVASSKVSRANKSAENVNDYLTTVISMINEMSNAYDLKTALQTNNDVKKELVIIVASDLGLAGAYNVNVLKQAREMIANNAELDFIVVGRKGRAIANELNKEIISFYEGCLDPVNEEVVYEIANTCTTEFKSGKYGKISLVYTKLVNPITFEPDVVQLYPFVDDLAVENKEIKNKNIELLPSREEVINNLIPSAIRSIIRGAFIQAVASEYSSRRMAMNAANENADSLIDSLEIQSNRIRQANITQEISEIVSGAESLK